MFGPQIIAEYDSKFSGKITVKKSFRDTYVTTGSLTQSGGLVKDVWQPLIKKYGRKHKSWLVLGLATGTVVKLLPSPSRVVGVEIDPVMLDISRKYFGLDAIPNLEIVNQDALDYTLKTRDSFDFILVDLYLGDQVPDFVYSKKFLEKLGQLGQLVIVNHLFYDEAKRQKVKKLIEQLSKTFADTKLHRVLTNVLIICSKTRYN